METSNKLSEVLNKVRLRQDQLNRETDGSLYSMNKQDVMEALTISLFEGYDQRIYVNTPSEPDSMSVERYLKTIKDMFESDDKPHMFISEQDFIVWYGRKNGDIRPYWEY